MTLRSFWTPNDFSTRVIGRRQHWECYDAFHLDFAMKIRRNHQAAEEPAIVEAETSKRLDSSLQQVSSRRMWKMFDFSLHLEFGVSVVIVLPVVLLRVLLVLGPCFARGCADMFCGRL